MNDSRYVVYFTRQKEREREGQTLQVVSVATAAQHHISHAQTVDGTCPRPQAHGPLAPDIRQIHRQTLSCSGWHNSLLLGMERDQYMPLFLSFFVCLFLASLFLVSPGMSVC